MAHSHLILDREGGIRIITLNRPESMNAMNIQLLIEMESVLDEINGDEKARVIILRGAGKNFCVGVDLKEMLAPSARQQVTDRVTPLFNKLESFDLPTIAVINGHCNGGGLELSLCCDFRIASKDAYFGLGEVKLGMIPGGGGTARLPRLIGPGRARELLYFGTPFDSNEAHQISLVNKVVAPEDLMTESRRWATALSESPPLSLKMLKRCINKGMQMDLASSIAYEARCVEILKSTEDLIEGIAAFKEKRKPVFKGK